MMKEREGVIQSQDLWSVGNVSMGEKKKEAAWESERRKGKGSHTFTITASSLSRPWRLKESDKKISHPQFRGHRYPHHIMCKQQTQDSAGERKIKTKKIESNEANETLIFFSSHSRLPVRHHETLLNPMKHPCRVLFVSHHRLLLSPQPHFQIGWNMRRDVDRGILVVGPHAHLCVCVCLYAYAQNQLVSMLNYTWKSCPMQFKWNWEW